MNRIQGGKMSGVQDTVSSYVKFLQEGPSGLSKGTATNYGQILKMALELANPEDFTDPQMLVYLRAAVNDSYKGTFTTAWKAFTQFCDIHQDIELPRVPEIRRVHLVHPIEPDLRIILSRYYDGIPEGLDWQTLVATETDQKFIRAAQRAYQFFTGTAQPRADQPLIPRTAESDEPMAPWVLEAILGTKRRMTTGPAELFHRDLNAQVAAAGLPVGLSKSLYGLFVVGGESIRRKTGGSREAMFEECEKAIQDGSPSTLLTMLKSYMGVTKAQEPEIAGVLFQ